MANNDQNNPRRNIDRPEDNPFIAFRRFADSQVSSLLNTVFTLPATIANYSNAHGAREQCLFGRADERKCDKLLELEKEAAEIRHQGQELYWVGDVQAVIKKSEELVKLDQQADELRRDILVSSGDSRQKELVERVGNEKGQQWGWSHSWGWPVPLEDERSATETRGRGTYPRELHDTTHFERQWNEFESQMQRWLKDETMRALWGDEPVDSEQRRQRGYPRAVPLEEQSDKNPAQEEWHERFQNAPRDRPLALLDALGDVILDGMVQMTRPHSSPHTHPYSPTALESDERMRHIQWRDAFEDLIRTERGAPLLPPSELGQSRNLPHEHWARRFQHQQDTAPWESSDAADEPSYEYAHDHEDQHDDPPTPKVGHFPPHHDIEQSNADAPNTELDLYERFLIPSAPTPPSSATSPILSTLTTTERTTAPDGTVTTKVVLKKRFADGREESSESVHTQHRDENAQSTREGGDARGSKKGGWFWSS